MSRQRKTVAVLCIALVVCGALLGAGPEIVWAELVPLWVVVPAVDVTTIVLAASRCDDQPTSLLSLVLLRAPPAQPSLA